MEVITPKDLADLKFGLEHNVDYVAMSFVGNAGDVFKLREEIKKLNKNIPIISKIERKVALDNLDEIIKVSDAIMIARGDLGNEVPLEDIPLVEEKIINILKHNKSAKISDFEQALGLSRTYINRLLNGQIPGN